MENYSLDQYNKVLASIGSFLPQALDNTDPEKIMAILEQKSEEEKAALVRSLNEYLTGQSSTIEQLAIDDYTIIKLEALPVNYDTTVSKAVETIKCDWKNSDITQRRFRFPTKRSGKADVKMGLFHFGKDMSDKAVLKAMDKAGYRPAELLELLAIGASPKYRNLQKEFPIIAMGSVGQGSNGGRCVLCLYRNGSGRYLDLDWLGYDWGDLCRFAGVRK